MWAPGFGHADPEVPDHADSAATTGDVLRGGPTGFEPCLRSATRFR